MALDALLHQTYSPASVVVVDNGSGDGSGRQLADAYPDIELVEVLENRGPIGGMNVAMRSLLDRDLEAILLLTHDCRLAPNALQLLVERLEAEPAVGAAGPLIADLGEPERVTAAGGRIDRRTWDTQSIDEPAALAEWRGRPPHTVDWINGSAMLIRAAAARQAGYFHEEFFYYFDEADYFLRFPPLGFRVECVPTAVAWQDAGEASPYVYVRNRLGFVARTAPRRHLAREIVRVPYLAVRDLIRPRYEGARSDVWPRLKGFFAFLANRWGRPPTPDRRSP